MNAPHKTRRPLSALGIAVIVGGFTLMALGLGATISACTNAPGTTPVPDAATVFAGCYAPNDCWKKTCGCLHRASIVQDCQTCDPVTATNQVCDCDGEPTDMAPPVDAFMYGQDGGTSACLEQSNVCVGQGSVCPGLGARCLAAGTSCSTTTTTFDPPQVVSTRIGGDGGVPGFVARCPYVDDVCCPGTIPDGGT